MVEKQVSEISKRCDAGNRIVCLIIIFLYMLKEFLMKKMLQSQLKNIPPAEREKILAMVEKDPNLFMRIAEEVKENMKGGKDQLAAATEVMQKHKDEIQKLL